MSPPTKPQVAFIGLGAMGFAMSTHLVKRGFPVTGFDIYQPTMEKWQAACDDMPGSKATTAKSPSEAVKTATVVCLMVANHHHIASALFDSQVGAVHALPKDCVVVIHATIPPTEPQAIRSRLTEEFNRPDIKLIDAPVSGGVARSQNGTLTIMVSSDDPAALQHSAAMTVIGNVASDGDTLFVIPGTLGAGQSAKALNQVQAGIHIPSASEIMGLAALNGLDTQKFYDTLTTNGSDGKAPVGWSWMFENRGPRMLSPDPPMASATSIINKDVGIIRGEEKRLGIELPLLNTASAVIDSVMKTHASADDSCIVQYYLGFGSSRANLVIERTGNPSTATTQQDQVLHHVASAHALIHLASAYETIQFAKALDLMRPDQRSQWYRLISGAAGGSTIFSEVIPLAFEDADGVEAAFAKYAQGKFGSAVDATVVLVENAKRQGYEPRILEAALRQYSTLTGHQ